MTLIDTLLQPRLYLCRPSKTLLRTKPIPTGTVFANLEIDFVSFFSWEKFFCQLVGRLLSSLQKFKEDV
jgi:hypothetical protein